MKAKLNLAKSEQGAHSANAERLRSAGVAIGIENGASSEPPQLRIDQSENSFIYAGVLKGMALAICVRLNALKSGISLSLEDCGITIPGCDDANIFFVPPPEGSLSYKAFEWLEIGSDAVLNHRIFTGRPLPCDRSFDGILVAQSFDSLPKCFQARMNINAKIWLVDQSNHPYTSDVELIVERHAQGRRPANRGDGLYAQKQDFGARPERRVQVQPASAVGKTVRAVKGNAGDSTARQ